MITNRMMVNINRNVRNVNTFFGQISTGKRFQVPSEDPISAARALKFRTSLKETQQYQRNLQQGMAWMEIAERGFQSIDSLMQRLSELSVQGATDTYTFEDRKKQTT